MVLSKRREDKESVMDMKLRGQRKRWRDLTNEVMQALDIEEFNHAITMTPNRTHI